eukprot:249393-Amphidinium_carterae.1
MADIGIEGDTRITPAVELTVSQTKKQAKAKRINTAREELTQLRSTNGKGRGSGKGKVKDKDGVEIP